MHLISQDEGGKGTALIYRVMVITIISTLADSVNTTVVVVMVITVTVTVSHYSFVSLPIASQQTVGDSTARKRGRRSTRNDKTRDP